MVIDRSLVRPWLDRVCFDPLIAFVPRYISPNTITLSGLVVCVGMLALLSVSRTPGAPLMLACALAVSYYMLADELDGRQARRLGRTSDFGALLDHGCDFINGQIILWTIFSLLDAGWVWLLATSSAYTAAFLATHIEHRTTGTLFFGAIGPLEALLAAIVFLLTYAVAPTAWTTPLIAQVTAGHALAALCLIGLLWSVMSVWLRLGARFLPRCGLPILSVCLAGAAAVSSNAGGSVFWLIQLGCGLIYGLHALYNSSSALGRLPVFLIGPLSLLVAVLINLRLINTLTGSMAAYLLLVFTVFALLAVALDIRRVLISPPR